MRRNRLSVLVAMLMAAVTLMPGAAKASVYSDQLGDNYGGPEVDISSVTVTNDANNIDFTININPAADLTTNSSAFYEVGIQTGAAGGQTAINGSIGLGNPTVGNPYGNAIGISTGENFFIGSFLNGASSSGGAQLYSYSSTSGWAQVGATAAIAEVPTGAPSLSFSFPLSALSLSPGNSFKFDVWTTFGSPQSAFDALDSSRIPPGTAPYAGGTYDSATADGSVLSVYTVVAVPEPASTAIFLGGVIALFRRRGRPQPSVK